jgi:transcriptional regulator with XRE-family HTH domain
MTMLDRILAILHYLNLSPSRFAESIGVQRSGISHLLSGRNKPSLEFIQKLLSRFPEIDPEWLLTGTGEMLKQSSSDQKVTITPDLVERQVNEMKEISVKQEPVKPPLRRKQGDTEESPIEKIVYFYRDKTFREYFPARET